MKKFLNLIVSCSLLIMVAISTTSANGGPENFCFDADVPVAQDNLSAMCLTAPVLFCPPTYLGCPSDDVNPSNTGFPIAMPGDSNCPTPVVSFSDVVISNTSCLKIIHRTWEASYPPGGASIKLHSTCQQTLYLEDDQAPSITNCPADLTLDLSVNCDSSAIWSLPVADDLCGIQYFITTHFSGATFSQGTTAVTYTAADFCGNETTCNFSVTVTGSCCDAPTLSCPADITICPLADSSPASTGFATASMGSSNCGTPVVTSNDVTISSGPCNGAFIIERTWTATDPNTNSNVSCTQLITAVDNNNPIITNGPSAITLTGTGNNCTAVATWGEPTVSDNCAAMLSSTHASGTTFTEGMTTVTYTAVDNCGNQATYSFNVTVVCVCNTAPVLTCPADVTACPGSTTTPSVTGVASAVAGDPSCGAPGINFTDVTTNGNGTCGELTIARTWTATVTNNNSLTTSCVQQISLVDVNAPTITNTPQNITLTGNGANCEAVATWVLPTATDGCSSANLSATHTSGSTFTQGTTTVTFTAVDDCGNVSTSSFNVSVVCACNTAPVLTCPADVTACPGSTTRPSVTGVASAVAGDPSCGAPGMNFTDVTTNGNGTCSELTIARTWTATVTNNNSLTTSCVQQISLIDVNAPTITNTPQNITLTGNGANCAAVATWMLPSATDGCSTTNLSATHNSGSTFTQGTTTVIYTAQDACGNQSTTSFTVTINCSCSQPPVISCPVNHTACPESGTDPTVTGAATAVAGDASCGAPVVTYNDVTVSSGPCSSELVLDRTWTASYTNSNLTASCVQTISLEVDDNGPVLTNIPADITVHGNGTNCAVLVKWSEPTATVSCGTATVSSNFSSGTSFPEGLTNIIYTAVDDCGNSVIATFNVTVECAAGCSSPPVMTCPPNMTTCVGGSIPSPSVAGVATATPGAANCNQPFMYFSDYITSFGACNGALTIERTWTGFDLSSGMSSNCVQILELGDSAAPVISNVPGNITLNGTGTSCEATATWTEPTVTDDCGINTVTSDFASGTSFGQGTTTIIYTATDNCGNVTTARFNVEVQCSAAVCSTPPTITCPANHMSCPTGTGLPTPSAIGVATAVAGSSDCGTPFITFTDALINSNNCTNGGGTYHRTWIASDPSSLSLSATCIQTITLQDNTIPVITNLPGNISLDGTGDDCEAAATWTTPTATDDCGLASLTSSHNSGQTFSQGSTTVTYTAVDNCGNVVTGSFTVSINCTTATCSTPPTISCPPNYTACADGNTPGLSTTGYAFGLITGPNCSGTPYTTFTDVVVSTGPCAAASVINRTWTSTDPNNKLQSSCVQTISLVDNNPPAIANLPSNIVVTGNGSGCQVPVTWSSPTATDDCGLSSLTPNIASGMIFSQGTTSIIYTAVDNCGNTTTASFTITVQCVGCTTPPTISCPPSITTCLGSDTDPTFTGTAIGAITGPNCSGAAYISYMDVVQSTGPCAGAEVINRTWMATNPSNNLATTCNQTITVTDGSIPVFSNVPGDIAVTGTGAGCLVPITWNVPVVSDDCGIASLTVSHTNGSSFSAGTTPVTYTATDNCGNSVTASFNVTVTCEVCNTAPGISCPPNYTACVGSGSTPSFAGVANGFATGNCTATPSITFTDNTISNGPCNGAFVAERTWVANDANTNLNTSCIQLITLGDNTGPVINNLPNNITVTGNGSNCQVPVTWTTPTAADNCGTASVNSNYASGSTFGQGSTTVTYTAIDNCGNTATASFVVTVTCAGCNTPPVASCPPNYTACPSTSVSPSVTGVANAYNNGANCNGTLNVTYTDNITNGSCAGAQTIHRNWTATDPSTGLSGTCVQVISLVDNTPPVLSNIPNNITVTGTGNNCAVAVTWLEPTATDNCSVLSSGCQFTNGAVFTEGTYNVIYTATDHCGNVGTGSFTITVLCAGCTTPPVVSCPPNYTACPSTSVSPSVTGVANAYNNGANCNGTPNVTYTDNITNGSCADAQTIHRNWTATDPGTGLSGTCVQVISLVDNTPPVLSNIPNNITVTGTGNNCAVAVTWLEPTATDNCSVLSSGCQFTNGAVFTEGTYNVIYTATDHCGNVGTGSFTITVLCTGCNTAPTIACPADYMTCPSGDTSPSVAGTATAGNNGANCNTTPVVTYNDVTISNGPCTGAKVIQRTWTATDPSTNLSSSCVQMITLDDDIAPTFSTTQVDISIIGSGTNCTAVATWTIPTATDDCGVDYYYCDYASGHAFPEGATTVTCTAVDFCGNEATTTFVVTVTCEVCTSTPLITCPADYNACPDGTIPLPSVSGTATAVPGETNCETPVVTYTDVVISTGPCAGQQVIERTWTATDPTDATLTATCTQLITLEDTTPPVLTGCSPGLILQGTITNTGGGTGSGTGSGTPGGPGTGTEVCEAVATWPTPNMSDDCSTMTLVATDQDGNIVASGDTFLEGTTTITYTATDACGNVATCSFDIIVSCSTECDIAPIAICPADVTVCIAADITPAATGNATFVSYPLCTIGVTHSDSLYATGTCTGEATIGRTFVVHTELTATTLMDSCVQIITIENTAPEIVSCPADITVNGDNTPVSWTAPVVTDVCGTAITTSTHAPGSTFECGLTTVTYTVTDLCGNVLTCSFDVTVECTAGGSGFNNCPSNMTVACGEPINWTPPSYTTNCTTCTTGANIPGFIYMGNHGGSNYYCSMQPAQWPVAKQVCEANGGFLADVNSMEENQFLADQLSIQSAWIGLTDVNSEGNFTWCNGQPVNYTNWYPGQPNNFNGYQDYCEMLSTGEWNDQNNNYSLEFIMEIPCTTISQTAGPAAGSAQNAGTYTVTYTVNDPCGSTETCSFDVTVEECTYTTCSSGGLVSTYHYIDGCDFGSISNTSGDNGGYADFTSICETIEPGLYVPISLTPGFGGAKPHQLYWTIWIDFNQDGDYYDNYEFVAYGAASSVINGGITIPTGIPNGTCNMRVTCKLGGYATDPCEVYLYGETEDYCINVINGTLKPDGDIDGLKSTSQSDPVLLTTMDIPSSDKADHSDNGVSTTTEEMPATLDRNEELEDGEEVLTVKVYPNPVSTTMNVELNQSDSVTAIGLFDIQGRQLKELEVADRISSNVSDFEGGTYLLRVMNDDGKVITKQIMILR